MMAKILTILAILFSGLFINTAPAFAENPTHNFLGLPAWYDNLPMDNGSIKTPENEDAFATYIWTIVLNVASLLLGLAGYICVLVVIYGGFLYLFSIGDPGRVAKGKKAITNALIGIVICMFSSVISSAISETINGLDKQDPAAFFGGILNYCFLWAGVICALMITISGIKYILSRGNPGEMTKAKSTLTYSIIGMVIVLLAAGIVNFIIGMVGTV